MSATLTAKQPIRTGDILLVSFMGTVVMLFAGFTSAFLIRRAGTDWSPFALPSTVWFSTAVLMASSITLEIACRRRQHTLVLASIVLGLAFLGGQLLVWSQLAAQGAGVGESAFSSFFYMFSGVHGVHLLGGLGGMLYVSIKKSGWRTSANYWHFMGVVWIYVLFLLAV